MFGFFKDDDRKVINVNDLDSLIGKVELLDVREPYEYKAGSLKTAKNVPMRDLINEPNKYINKDNVYYIVCQSGSRSRKICKFLDKQGFNVIDVTGGIGSYVGTKRK